MEAADIGTIFRHDLGHGRNGSRRIFMKNDQRRILPGKGNLHSIHSGDQNITSADTAAPQRHLFPVFGCQGDFRRIGMGIFQFSGFNLNFQAFPLRYIQGKTNALVIGLHPQDSCHQCLIRSVSFIGFRKGTVQKDMRLHRSFPKQSPGHKTNSGCPCCV